MVNITQEGLTSPINAVELKDCPSTLVECTPFKDEKGEGYEFTFQLEYEEELKLKQ
tara:strand:+ start:592 stop:759 length:168 start_codon:yes stop_codon:yes gene_type:complete